MRSTRTHRQRGLPGMWLCFCPVRGSMDGGGWQNDKGGWEPPGPLSRAGPKVCHSPAVQYGQVEEFSGPQSPTDWR